MALTMRTSRLQTVSARRAFKATPVARPVVRVQASAAVSEIVDKLKTLSLLEASELVAEIEKTFGVDASAGEALGSEAFRAYCVCPTQHLRTFL